MEKTHLGISVGLLAAIMYLMGLLNLLGLLVMAGYVLLCETNDWLRKSAVKAVVIYAVFAVISVVLGIFDDGFGILNTMIGWIFSFRVGFPLNLDDIVGYVASILRTLIYLVLAAMALKQKTVNLGPLDNLIEKHLGTNSAENK